MSCAQLSFNSTSQLTTLKNTLPLWEDMVAKTMKLNSSLRSVILCVAGFLEAFQKIADTAYSSNCGLRELGSNMTRFCLRERGLESRLRTFNSLLLDCLAAPLTDRLEEWRRTVVQMDRENNKEWRKARNELQRVTGEFDKLNRRFRKKTSTPSQLVGAPEDDGGQHTGDNMQLNFVQHDLQVKQQTLADLERSTLKRAVVEERRRFSELITCLKPVLDAQSAIFSDVDSIDECIHTIGKYVCDPNILPPDIEQAIEEAVKNVSVHSQPPERKFSDVRAAMRFGRNPFSDFPRPSLSGHHASSSSQLSLRSNRSTSSSWNASEAAVAATTQANVDTCSTSPTQNGMYAGVSKQGAVSPGGSVSNSSGFGHQGDSYSLFEHANSHVDSLSLGPAGSGCMNGSICNGAVGSFSSPTGTNHIEQSIPSRANAAGLETTLIPLNDVRCANDLVEDDDGGGATTEDTEDGETDEDPSGDSFSRELDNDTKSQPILYPNQAIPAPVYTNLHELKRAAARKFGNTDSESRNPSIDQANTDLGGRGHSDNAKETNSINSNTDVASSPNRFTTTTSSVGDGYITTQINCGTSTFRRRQSEYDKRKPNSEQSAMTNGGRSYGGCTSVLHPEPQQQMYPVDAVPAAVGGRMRNRPTRPPRRSSSMNRDHSSYQQQRYSSMDPYTAYPPLNQPQMRRNGIESGIQRVSSSVFTQNSCYTMDGTHRSRTTADPFYQHYPQYASVLTSHPNHNISPPLATVQAPEISKHNHLMFGGIKVLPNQSPPPPAAGPVGRTGGGGRTLRHLQRQASCEPPGLKSTHIPPPTSGMGSPALNRAVGNWLPQPNVAMRTTTNQPQQHQSIRCQDDASTSFID